MLVRPDLPDEGIVTSLRSNYGIDVSTVESLPLGNDSSARAYRLRDEAGRSFFLKVRRGAIYEPSISVPSFLRDRGVEQVVAPLAPMGSGNAWVRAGEYTLTLYPFILSSEVTPVDGDTLTVEFSRYGFKLLEVIG